MAYDKGGRPRIGDGTAKTQYLHFRLTEKQYADIKEKLKESGYAKMSDFLIDTLYNSEKKFYRHCDDDIYTTLMSAIAEIKKIGRNINQATMHINAMAKDIPNKQLLMFELGQLRESDVRVGIVAETIRDIVHKIMIDYIDVLKK